MAYHVSPSHDTLFPNPYITLCLIFLLLMTVSMSQPLRRCHCPIFIHPTTVFVSQSKSHSSHPLCNDNLCLLIIRSLSLLHLHLSNDTLLHDHYITLLYLPLSLDNLFPSDYITLTASSFSFQRQSLFPKHYITIFHFPTIICFLIITSLSRLYLPFPNVSRCLLIITSLTLFHLPLPQRKSIS